MRCFIYYNLHKHCLSVRALSGPDKGRVIAHANALLLESAIFRVSEAGRQRVLRERSKNVHAGMVGELTMYAKLDDAPDAKLQQLYASAIALQVPVITYNPYQDASFVVLPERVPIQTASRVLAVGKQVFALPD